MGPGKKTPTPQTAHWSFSARVLRERPRDAPQGCAAPPPPQPVPASLLVGELRAPFWVRSHHVTSTKTGGPSGKLRQRWDLGPRGAARGRGEEETERGWEKAGRGGLGDGKDGALGPGVGKPGRRAVEPGEREARGAGPRRRPAGAGAQGCVRPEGAGRQRPACRARRAARPLVREAARRAGPGRSSARHVARAPGGRQRPAQERLGAREPGAATGSELDRGSGGCSGWGEWWARYEGREEVGAGAPGWGLMGAGVEGNAGAGRERRGRRAGTQLCASARPPRAQARCLERPGWCLGS